MLQKSPVLQSHWWPGWKGAHCQSWTKTAAIWKSREVTARLYPGRILLGNGMIITIKKWIWGANFVVKPYVCKSNTYIIYTYIIYTHILYINIYYKYIYIYIYYINEYIYIYYPLSRSSLENLLLSMFRWFSDWARSNSIIYLLQDGYIYMTNNARMMWHVVPQKKERWIITNHHAIFWEGRQFTYFP